jgi:hypothetical protein
MQQQFKNPIPDLKQCDHYEGSVDLPKFRNMTVFLKISTKINWIMVGTVSLWLENLSNLFHLFTLALLSSINRVIDGVNV